MEEGAVTEQTLLRRGARLGRYEIRELVGRGGMGEVYRAWDPLLQRDVAVKVLTACEEGMLRRFKREAEAIGRLDNHNVVEIHDCRIEAEPPYIVMELLRGQPLTQRLVRGPMPVAEAVAIVLGVCRGVAACHRVGIIHRDVKPANVFLAETAHYGTVVKVLDFGVAKPARYLAADVTGPQQQVMGTPRYIAPEQLVGLDADELSDQYGICLLLYAALTGRPPFGQREGLDLALAILQADYPKLGQVRPDVEANLAAIVTRGLSVDRRRRFPTVMALGRALVEITPPERREPWEDHFAEHGGFSASADPSPSVTMVKRRGQVAATRMLAPDEIARLLLDSLHRDGSGAAAADETKRNPPAYADVAALFFPSARLRGERSPASPGGARGVRGLVSESEPSPREMSARRAKRHLTGSLRLGVGLLSASAALTALWLVLCERDGHLAHVSVELPTRTPSAAREGNPDEQLPEDGVGSESDRGRRSANMGEQAPLPKTLKRRDRSDKSDRSNRALPAPLGSASGRWQSWSTDERGQALSRRDRSGGAGEATEGLPILW
jgi:serine/threonine-protein kinase